MRFSLLAMAFLVGGASTGMASLGAQTLSPRDLSTWLEARNQGKRAFLLVDVRTPEEHREGFIPGTDTLIPMDRFFATDRPINLDPEQDTIVVYCRTGRRAGEVQKRLKELGYRWVFNALGVVQWVQSGGHLIRESGRASPADSTDVAVPDGIVPASRVCMTQDDVYPRDLIPVEVDGETYYGCCPGCAAAIQANPDRFIWAVDPVSGRRIKKSRAVIYSYRGKAYYFESQKTLETFRKNPDAFLGSSHGEGS